MCHSQQYQWLSYRLKRIERDQLLGRMLDLHNHPLNARELHWIVSIPTNELRYSAIDTISHFLDGARQSANDGRYGSIKPVGISPSRSP
jgi:hypothetical protein